MGSARCSLLSALFYRGVPAEADEGETRAESEESGEKEKLRRGRRQKTEGGREGFTDTNRWREKQRYKETDTCRWREGRGQKEAETAGLRDPGAGKRRDAQRV